ncbi:type II CAAX prenyl endopeptidase Rce1 family protein [Halococcus salsus]|uniref:CPBP family glutamic-type intramembrane protease n=1 Tax=Halococcus salsus TaxID=2162894 RepID=UPI00135A5D0E|nr:CPBP family glutamic-type intramembrane protease [Halococcus salsus]
MAAQHRAVREHPVLGFVLLSIVFSWAMWGVQYLWPRNPVALIAPLPSAGPAVAAVVVAHLSGFDLRAWRDHLGGRDVEPYWYGVGLALPLACVIATTIAAALLFNGPWAVPFFTPQRAAGYAVSLLFSVIPALGVEAGFRGFALPRLQHRYDALVASAFVAVAWAVWSLPLFVFPGTYLAGFSLPVAVLLLVVVSVFLTYVYNSTGGSVPVTALLNGGLVTSLTYGAVGASGVEIQVTTLAAWAIPALVVANLYGRERLADEVSAPRFLAES